MYPLFLWGFSETWIFSTHSKISQIADFIKDLLMGAESSMRTDGRRDMTKQYFLSPSPLKAELS